MARNSNKNQIVVAPARLRRPTFILPIAPQPASVYTAARFWAARPAPGPPEMGA